MIPKGEVEKEEKRKKKRFETATTGYTPQVEHQRRYISVRHWSGKVVPSFDKKKNNSSISGYYSTTTGYTALIGVLYYIADQDKKCDST